MDGRGYGARRQGAIRGLLVALLAALGLAALAAASAHAAYPGANGKIAFVKEGGIHTVEADGTGLTALSRAGSISADSSQGIAWSRSGRQLAGTVICGRGSARVYALNSDGSGERYVSPTCASEAGPTWGPGDTRLGFQKKLSQQLWSNAHTRAATGGDLRRLSSNQTGGEENLKWSPDGTRFAFHRGGAGCNRIWTMTSTGASQRRITNGPGADSSPDWSPDNRQIVFGSTRESGNCIGPGGIYVMNADGTGVRRLTAPLPAEGRSGQYAPVFSPDGRFVAYNRDRGLGTELWVIAIDGTGDHKVADGFGAPTWQPLPAGSAPPPAPAPPALASFTTSSVFAPGSPNGGGGTVTLDRAAPPGGVTVALSSSDPAVASVPASVTVPAGQTSQSFSVATGRPETTTAATLTATLAGVSRTATVSIPGRPRLVGVTLPATVAGGSSVLGFATLSEFAPGEVITLTSSDPAAASVPASVTTGGQSGNFTLVTNRVTQATPVTITASYGGATVTHVVTVSTADPLASVTAADGALRGICPGGSVDNEVITVRLADPPAGTTTITMASSDPALAQVEGELVTNAQENQFFVTSNTTVTTATQVTISVTAVGQTKQVTLRLNPCSTTTAPPPPPPPPPPTGVDNVSITLAQYDAGKRELRVEATSTSSTATLTARPGSATATPIGTLRNDGGGRYRQTFTNVSNPGTLYVTSSLGGSASRTVSAG